MENKDIEQLLKESADEVKVKDFSERWENIKDRICSTKEIELKETTSETVLATSANSNLSQNSVRKKIIISVCAIFLLIGLCLAIVLPLTLKNNDKIYFNLNELKHEIVTEDEFYAQIEETALKIFDLKSFEVDNFVLYYTEDNIVVGGKIEISDEETFATVVFYNTSVKSSFEIGTDNKTCVKGGYNIEYITEIDADELYSSMAKAVGANISYEFDCLSLDENIETFFEKIFG
ncbi:MAG: hypothetical protein HDP34_01025 [Clostridia bacterium]|nr:hypothetical protein [Clostridia bacterium]